MSTLQLFYEDEINLECILYSVVVLECLTVIMKQNNEYKQMVFNYVLQSPTCDGEAK